MTPRLGLRSALVLAALALAGCAVRTGMGSMVADGDDSSEGTDLGDGDDSDDGDDSSGDTSLDDGEDEALPEEFCADACPAPLDVGCLTPDSCVAYCEAESGSWDTDLGEAFATCVATNPLCYETVESCMFNVLHPPGSSFDLRLRGAGLDDLDGKVVYAWHDPASAEAFSGEAVIEGGAFELRWSEAVPVFGLFGPLVLVYVDVDDDGECDPDIDLTASANLEWTGDYAAPVFETVLSPPLGSSSFVCDYLP